MRSGAWRTSSSATIPPIERPMTAKLSGASFKRAPAKSSIVSARGSEPSMHLCPAASSAPFCASNRRPSHINPGKKMQVERRMIRSNFPVVATGLRSLDFECKLGVSLPQFLSLFRHQKPRHSPLDVLFLRVRPLPPPFHDESKKRKLHPLFGKKTPSQKIRCEDRELPLRRH